MSIIPQAVFNKYDEFTQHFLDDFGTDCSLIYVDKIEEYNSPLEENTKRNSLGIRPSPNGISRGDETLRLVEQTESIRLRVYWTQEDFKKISSIVLPLGGIATYGLITDLHKIERAKALVIYAGSSPDHREWRFQRYQEPIVHGLTDKEFIAFWTRI